MISVVYKRSLVVWMSMVMVLILSQQSKGTETPHTKVDVEDINIPGQIYSSDYERFIFVRLSDTDPWLINPAGMHIGASYWAVNGPMASTLKVRIYDDGDNDVTDQFFKAEQVMPLSGDRRPFLLSPVAFAHYADGFLDVPLPMGSYDVISGETGLDEARTYRHVLVKVQRTEEPIPEGEYTVVAAYKSESQAVEKSTKFTVLEKTIRSVTLEEAEEKVKEQIGVYTGYPIQIYSGQTPYWAVNVFDDAARSELRGTAFVDGIGGRFVSPGNTPHETINNLMLVAMASDDFTDFGWDPLAEGVRMKWYNAAEGDPDSLRADYQQWDSLANDFYAAFFRQTMYKYMKFQAGALLQLVGAGSSIPALIVDKFILPAADATGFVETNPINLMFGNMVNDFDKGNECRVAAQIAYQQWQLALHVEYLLNSHIQYAAKSVGETEEILRCMDVLNELEIQRLQSSMRYMCYVREDNDGEPDRNPGYDVSPTVFESLAGAVSAIQELGRNPVYDRFRQKAAERVLCTPVASVPLDLNGDQIVNLMDFSILANRWLATCSYPDWCEANDFDWSGQVDLGDVQLLASQWLEGPTLPGMVRIPAGEFLMGDDSGSEDEKPAHSVKLNRFYMSKYEVTKQQYCEFLNSARSQGLISVAPIDEQCTGVYKADTTCLYCVAYLYGGIVWDGSGFYVVSGKENHPIASVTWHGAVAYCNWRSQQEQRQPCYDLSTWGCDYSKNGYRLPTEAEWEYAAKGGLSGKAYPWGDTLDPTYANWRPSGDPYEDGLQPWTTPVGFYDGSLRYQADFHWPGDQTSYQTSNGANGYGLYDMAGNVCEWCNDWYSLDFYGTTPYPHANPTGPATGEWHVLRGGGWANTADCCMVAWRWSDGPPGHGDHIGFRIVLEMK
jgi:formylglycine-generating enzyme required for sulfatase activity